MASPAISSLTSAAASDDGRSATGTNFLSTMIAEVPEYFAAVGSGTAEEEMGGDKERESSASIHVWWQRQPSEDGGWPLMEGDGVHEMIQM